LQGKGKRCKEKEKKAEVAAASETSVRGKTQRTSGNRHGDIDTRRRGSDEEEGIPQLNVVTNTPRQLSKKKKGKKFHG